jgi:sulfoxide reductase heme-binding subunit YedZ
MPLMLSRLSPYPLWLLLSILPALWLAQALGSADPDTFEALLHPTGEMSARLLIVTPLAMLFPQSGITRWLRRHRRHLGVAAFAYAALHAAFYLADLADPGRIVAELPHLYVWTGSLAFAIFVPLAATSTDRAVRRMGRRRADAGALGGAARPGRGRPYDGPLRPAGRPGGVSFVEDHGTPSSAHRLDRHHHPPVRLAAQDGGPANRHLPEPGSRRPENTDPASSRTA